ncbi:hypothetical protein [Erythrobacter aureus]|uniref:Uncharacterized protein n=1 Tax=Erythrobacter aureus TaxID=2182384 RepID=A0A345YJG2_9SPHN|nr:hypothetical protein [Erythrobacter aureus]AXK44064.1 hypothetical protein DVR09_16560 [Erythrobacter aureus]
MPELKAELKAKAHQSTRRDQRPQDHVCWRAMEHIETVEKERDNLRALLKQVDKSWRPKGSGYRGLKKQVDDAVGDEPETTVEGE